MRREIAAVLVLLFAGCVGAEEKEEPVACEQDCFVCEQCVACEAFLEAAAAPQACPSAEAPDPDAPMLPAGRAWTYRAELLYNPATELTVVVAQAGGEGYLFAGGTKEQVATALLWGEPWFGAVGPGLDADGGVRLFDFPLEEGKSWDFFKGLPVTAHATDVPTPWGIERGWHIGGVDDRRALAYEYAPRLGFLVRYAYAFDGVVRDSLELTAMREGAPWVWAEVGDAAESGEAADAAALVVESGWDEVIASAGGMNGGRALLLPPPTAATAPWVHEVAAEESWTVARWPAAEGAWLLKGAAPPEGWGWIRAAPVRWLGTGVA